MKTLRWIRWSLLGLILIGIALWAWDTYTLALNRHQTEVQLALQEMKEGIEAQAQCYYLVNEIEIPENGQLVLLQVDTNGQSDSIASYTGIMGANQRPFPEALLDFETRARVQLNFRVEYLPSLPGQISSAFQQWVDSSYQHYITDSVNDVRIGDSAAVKQAVTQALTNHGIQVNNWQIERGDGSVLYRLHEEELSKANSSSIEVLTQSLYGIPGNWSVRISEGKSPIQWSLFLRRELFFGLGLIGLVFLLLWAIEKTLQREKRLAESQRSMLNHLSHEFNTQVAKIVLSVEGIRDQHQHETHLDNYLDILHRASHQLTQNLDTLLLSGPLQDKAYSASKSEVDLEEILLELQEEYSPQMQEKNKILQLDGEPPKVTVEFNRLHLKQVLSNLIDNALKYGGDRIRLWVDRSSQALTLTIEDNGSGVEDSLLPRLFDPYVRDPKHNTSGFGIGLSYCKAVMEAHAGEIRAENLPGTGFRIHLKIPQT